MGPLREHLVALLKGGQAFDRFDSIVGEFSPEERGAVPAGAEHSAWQILEHMRIALRDILDFSQNENGTYKELKWPEEYWPSSTLPGEEAWEETIGGYLADLAEMEKLVSDPSRDLFRPFPWGDGQTLLREAMLTAQHEAYHLGELVELRRWLQAC